MLMDFFQLNLLMIANLLLFNSQHLIHFQRLRLAFDRKWNKWFCVNLILYTLIRFPADQDLISRTILLNVCGCVNTIADGSVFQTLFCANPSQDGFPIMDAHAKGEMGFLG